MVKDVNLRLANAADITATGQQTAVDTEGGFRADVSLQTAAITGTTPTARFQVEASIDGCSTYFHIGEFPLLDGADDDIRIMRSVYVPKPASGQTVTKVRLAYIITGTTPVYNDVTAYLEPMLSLAAKETDVDLAEGLAKLT